MAIGEEKQRAAGRAEAMSAGTRLLQKLPFAFEKFLRQNSIVTPAEALAEFKPASADIDPDRSAIEPTA